MSAIWSYYYPGKSPLSRQCKLCDEEGKFKVIKIQSKSTSNLISHLRRQHLSEYAAMKRSQDASLAANFEVSSRKMDPDDVTVDELQIISQITAGNINLEAFKDGNSHSLFRPFHVRGFISPTRWKIVRAIRSLVDRKNEEVLCSLRGCESWSMNISVWPTKSDQSLFLVVILNFLNQDGARKSLVARVQDCDVEMDSDEFEMKLSLFLEEIYDGKRGHMKKFAGAMYSGPKNLIPAFSSLKIRLVPCCCETLQFVLEKSISSVEFVRNLFGKFFLLVIELYRTQRGRMAIRMLELEEKLVKRPLLQNIKTWSSFYYLLKWVADTDRHIIEELCAAVGFEPPSCSDWEDIPQICQLLQIFHDVNNEILYKCDFVSQIIPNLILLRRSLEITTVTTSAAVALKNEILEQVEARLAAVKDNLIWRLATFLDSRSSNFQNIFPGKELFNIEEDVVQYIRGLIENGELEFGQNPLLSLSFDHMIKSELSKYRKKFLSEKILSGDQCGAIWWIYRIEKFPLLSRAALRVLSFNTSSLANQTMRRPVTKLHAQLRRSKCSTLTMENLLRIRANEICEEIGRWSSDFFRFLDQTGLDSDVEYEFFR
ncbi:unnamed protein product [Caenorhabditis auriculariae]|uniref:BED-type domain-containing protein n=1 Tax=Caenorhabditis auriculariae TaxID=2777116 RepID=A0A8S1HHE2_9PELO|nr:unnamed protein product [Caenorhabditis auriculariae]